MSWGPCGTQNDTAPLSVINCLRKNDIAFFDIVRLGSDGETNSLDGVNSTERAALEITNSANWAKNPFG